MKRPDSFAAVPLFLLFLCVPQSLMVTETVENYVKAIDTGTTLVTKENAADFTSAWQ